MEVSDVRLRFNWVTDGHDFILHLGNMKKAIMVAKYISNSNPLEWLSSQKHYYSVSPRSYFPFTNGQMDKRFKNNIEAMVYAEEIFCEWAKSFIDMVAIREPYQEPDVLKVPNVIFENPTEFGKAEFNS